MIAVNKIIPQNWEAFDPENNSLGFLNVFECNDLRIQIATEKVDGYYFKFNDRRIYIKSNGKLDGWPNGFYDMYEYQLRKLLNMYYEKT